MQFILYTEWNHYFGTFSFFGVRGGARGWGAGGDWVRIGLGRG